MSDDGFAPVLEILDELRAGRMVILTDDESRENEGDLVLAAEKATPEAINFMLTAARGYMCLSLTGADCDRLELRPQASSNTTARGTAFTVSIDGHPRHGFTTGVSARERARTILLAIDPRTVPEDFVRPGHINPLRARDGGVLVRNGQTEGSVDLCRLAGLHPSAVIIEIMRDDGEMARLPDLRVLARRHGIKLCSVAQVVEHRLARESLVRRLAPAEGEVIRTRYGEFRLIAYESMVDPLPHVALVMGDVGRGPSAEPTLVRMHRRRLLGDVFLELGADGLAASGDTLHAAMAAIKREGRGAIVYLRPESLPDQPGSGWSHALERRLQMIRRGEGEMARSADAPDLSRLAAMTASGTPSGMMRDYGIGCQILRDLGITRVRLLTNSTTGLPGVEAFGVEIVERVGVG